jgi:hypothetical protein
VFSTDLAHEKGTGGHQAKRFQRLTRPLPRLCRCARQTCTAAPLGVATVRQRSASSFSEGTMKLFNRVTRRRAGGSSSWSCS